MSNNEQQNGWNEWSKHVLKELQRLNEGQASIRSELQGVKNGMMKISVIENNVNDIKTWRSNVTEVCSPTQLKESLKDVDDLKAFKSKAIAIFTFAQISLTILIAIVAAVAGIFS